MIKDEREIHGYRIDAEDGELGEVEAFLFKDGDWVIRYLVVDLRKWFSGRKVLISPIAIQEVRHDEQSIFVSLTKEQVKNSPDIDTTKTVARQEEIKLNQHYGWGHYWMGSGAEGNAGSEAGQGGAPWGSSVFPGLLLGQNMDQGPEPEPEDNPEKSQFRSTLEVRNYMINAVDGSIGHVENFLIDDETWEIRYIVIDTKNWWPGKKILISADWIEDVNWGNNEVSVRLEKKAIKQGPVYDFDLPLSRDFEEELYQAYGKPPYWKK